MAEPEHGRVFRCAQCGVEGQQRTGRGRPRKVCVSCAPRTKAKTFSLEVARRRAASPTYRLHTCAVCGSEFFPKRADRLRCCSRECGFILLRRERSTASEGRRERKRAEVRAKRQDSQLRWMMAPLSRWLAKEVTFSGRASAPCKVCGEPVGYPRDGRPRSYCSEACIKKSEPHRAGQRATKAKREARKRGVHAERFDPIDVLRRDGWRCHLCGRKTPERLRGTSDPRAPELDHIVPLAAGGPHTRANTACACRSCNGAKGAEPKGQPRLFG